MAKEIKAREAILRKRCGVGADYDFRVPDKPGDPFDEYYTVVKANDCTKNISEPLFSAGLVRDDYVQKGEEPFADKSRPQTPSGKARWRDGRIRLHEGVNYTP